jgi:FkbM family methyltransferase
MIQRLSTFIRLLIGLPFGFTNWYLAYGDVFKLLRFLKIQEIIYKTRSGERYYARPSQYDIGILSEVFVSHTYDPSDHYRIRKTDIVLDAGGYIGDFTLFAAARCLRGKVYVFEPIKENFDLLKRNITLNSAKNVVPFMNALTGTSQKMSFYIQNDAYGASSLYPSHQSNQLSAIAVETIGINTFLRSEKIQKLDVIKLDCEGAEYDIIYQLPQSVLKKVRVLMIEYHRVTSKNKTHTPEHLRMYLENHGFTTDMDSDTSQFLGNLYCYKKVTPV